jgi:hypothetical protein
VIPSILNSVKMNLGLTEDYDVYDASLTLYINAVFSTLHQLGVGPEDGFEITGPSEEWDDLLEGDKRYNSVKSYVTLRVRLLFDPPQTSFLDAAFDRQIKELEYRIREQREEDTWVAPTT